MVCVCVVVVTVTSICYMLFLTGDAHHHTHSPNHTSSSYTRYHHTATHALCSDSCVLLMLLSSSLSTVGCYTGVGNVTTSSTQEPVKQDEQAGQDHQSCVCVCVCVVVCVRANFILCVHMHNGVWVCVIDFFWLIIVHKWVVTQL